jgi:stalled ribosome alternative rescue factor ArfA
MKLTIEQGREYFGKLKNRKRGKKVINEKGMLSTVKDVTFSAVYVEQDSNGKGSYLSLAGWDIPEEKYNSVVK